MSRMAAWRAWAVCVLTAALLFGVRSTAEAHATLLRASPAAGALLPTAPGVVRLVFDEPLDLSVSRLVVVDGHGQALAVQVSLDPHDVHALVGRLPIMGQGAYRVQWSTVSADGHAVSGSYVFRVGGDAFAAPPPPGGKPVAGTGARAEAAGAIALRALGDLLAALTGGLLFFAVLFGGGTWPEPARRARSVAVAGAAVTPLALAAHDAFWALSSAPHGARSGAWLYAMIMTGQGQLEIVRLGLALLVAWALLLMRRETVALAFAVLLLGATGGVGHALVLHSGFAVPLKAAHCLAMSAWLGGLGWILLRDRADVSGLAREIGDISNVALAAVLVIAASGLGMAGLFVPLDREHLLHSRYALLLALKVLGLLVLAGFGWLNRGRHVPRLRADTGGAAGAAGLRGNVLYEAVVIIAVFALGAWLSYTSPH